MRGVTFSIEAAFTVLIVVLLASHFVFTSNQDHLVAYSVVASDVASLASEGNFWSFSSFNQQSRVDGWSLKTGLCVKLIKDVRVFSSSNCAAGSNDYAVVVDRVYFDKVLGVMDAFKVQVSPPG